MSAKDVSSFFTGFFVGALVGGAAALLMTPQTGEETRTQIRDKSIEIREKAEETYGDLSSKIDEQTAELRSWTQDLSTKVDELVVQGKEEITRLRKLDAEEVPAAEIVEQVSAEA